MRPVEMPGHRDFRALNPDLSQDLDGLSHLGIDRRIAFGMTKAFAQNADAQSLCRLAERCYVITGARRDRPRVPTVMTGNHREQPRDVFDACAHRTAMIDGIT